MDHILSELSTTTCPSWVALHGTAHIFIELDKAMVLVWLDWLVFCKYGFSVSALWCPFATSTILLGFLLLGRGVSPHSPMNSMKRQKDRTLKEELPRLVGTQYATREQWRNNSRKNEETEPKQKQQPVVNVTGDRSKVRCCKEQHCKGTWTVRSINHGKLEVAKQQMAKVNFDFLGNSKLKWTGMGELNSDDHYIYYCGQESFRRNGVAIKVSKRVWNAVLRCNLKNNRMISAHFQGKHSKSQ